MAVVTTETKRNEREENDRKLSSYQTKKGAVLFGAVNANFRAGTPVAFLVVDRYISKVVEEEAEVTDDETGEIVVETQKVTKQIPAYRWELGKVVCLQPTQTGMNYQIVDNQGNEHSIIRRSVISREMFETIKYKPTPVLMYNEKDELVMVTMYTWDSIYFACPFLKNAHPLLHRDMKDFIEESESMFTITGDDEDQIIFEKDGVQYGPMPCTLLSTSDCRQCVAQIVNFADNWDAGRQIVAENCGRGTMYNDGKFIIRRNTKRALFIRWIYIDQWVKSKGFPHLDGACDAIREFFDRNGLGIPEEQAENIREWAKEQLKARDSELKKAGDEDALKKFRKWKRSVNKKLRELPILTEEQLAVEDDEEEEDSEE
jgi:hypothetical protein